MGPQGAEHAGRHHARVRPGDQGCAPNPASLTQRDLLGKFRAVVARHRPPRAVRTRGC